MRKPYKLYYAFDIHLQEERERFIDFFNTFYNTSSLTDPKKMWGLLCDAEVVKNCRNDILEGATLTERSAHNSSENHVLTASKSKTDTVFMATLTLSLTNPNCLPVRTENFFIFKDSRPCTAYLISEDAVSLPNQNIKLIQSLKPPSSCLQSLYNSFIHAFAYTPEIAYTSRAI